MPRVVGDSLQFVYLCDPTRLIDEDARTILETLPTIAGEDFRGALRRSLSTAAGSR
jgi:hypothetical protein